MTVMRPNNRLVSSLVPAALVVGLAVLVAVASSPAYIRSAEARPDAATITLSPSPATISGCDIVTVTVMVNDVAGLYGADLRLAFDPKRLEVVDANGAQSGIQSTPGGFLTGALFTVFNTADNSLGTIQYAATQISPTLAATGTGPLLKIMFRAKVTGTSNITFTFTQLADRNGQTIVAAAANGSAIASGPTAPTVSIGKVNATDARLSWPAIAGTTAYNLYRGTAPYFNPTEPPYATTTGLIYTDTNVLGNTSTNYYYVVRSTCANDLPSGNSNRVGEYDFPLRAVSPSNYNDISIVFENPSFTDTASLAAYVGSSARRILRYDASTQTFQTYNVGNPATNFGLAPGQFVYVLTNNTAPSSLALVGQVPAVGAFSFALVSGSPPRYNFMSIPLERSDLNTASAVVASFGAGVWRVIRYQTDAQSFETYIPGNSATNFVLAVGEPFGVRLLSGAPSNWP